MKIHIDTNSKTPVYKQIIDNIHQKIDSGELKTGDIIPSMNELSENLQISKETVKKAYNILRDKGTIDSKPGKGCYISKSSGSGIEILFLLDKISTYKQVLYSSFAQNINRQSEITIRIHNQDINLFEHFVDENLDNFDYYIITPHFPLQTAIQNRVKKILRRIPNRKLILLDKYVDIPGHFGSVHQDYGQDIFDGLTQGLNEIKKYKKFKIISTTGSLYAPPISVGIEKFCDKYKINYEFFYNVHDRNIIQKGDLFLILNGQLDIELIEIVRMAKSMNFQIGKDIGIISYNESPINEIILNGLTVLSTDFEQMGRVAASMINNKSMQKIKCDFRLIRRSTF